MGKKKQVPVLRFPGFLGEWEEKALLQITGYVDYRGKTPTKTESGIYLVTAKNIRQGYIDYETSKEFVSPADYEEIMRRGKPLIGDVLITTEAPMGNVATVDRTDIALAQRVIKFRGNAGLLSNLFLKFTFIGPRFQKLLDEKGTGSTAKGIKGSVLHQLPVAFPTLPEQTKIAGFLSAVDEKLQALKQKKAALEVYKKGVMQKLFSQELRFRDAGGKDFPDWEEKRLGDVAVMIKRREGKVLNPLEVLTISSEFGFLRQQDKFSQIIAGESLGKYTLLNKGEMSYNKGASKRFQYGCFFVLKEYESALVPNVYISFGFNSDANSYFYEYLFSTGFANQQLKKMISSSVRLDGLLNINKEEFFSMLVPFPSLPEQTKIADFLSSLDAKIQATHQEIGQLEVWKKGLLQRMFV